MNMNMGHDTKTLYIIPHTQHHTPVLSPPERSPHIVRIRTQHAGKAAQKARCNACMPLPRAKHIEKGKRPRGTAVGALILYHGIQT